MRDAESPKVCRCAGILPGVVSPNCPIHGTNARADLVDGVVLAVANALSEAHIGETIDAESADGPCWSWFKPYVAGFYAWYHNTTRADELTREEVEANLDYYLNIGQPWLASTPPAHTPETP